MAVATIQRDFGTSITWRQFQQACVCVVLALGAGCVIYAVETLLLHCERRFVENPADTITRAVGIAHFSIGWLFLFTSPRLRNGFAVTRLSFCTLMGVTFCTFFAWGGADKNPLMLMAFYSFFFIHEVCDEAHLFRHSGELAPDAPGSDRFLASLCTSMSLVLMTILGGIHFLRGHWLGRSDLLQDLSTLGLLAGWMSLAMLAGWAILRTWRTARKLYGTVRETVHLYRPLLGVYLGISTILLVGSLFGSVGANLVILVHGMTWLVCTQRKLSERNAEITGLWSWLRHSPTGFLTLHIGLTILVLFLFAMRTHVWLRTGFVCDLLSKTNFPYWSIMHIATAFWRAK